MHVRFGRDLTPDEWRGYRKSIAQGKQTLGVDKLCLISPVRSLPVEKGDPGIGSTVSAKPFWQFLTQLGFDTVQIDPAGKTRRLDPSPYTGTAFSRNPLYINLAPLAGKAWGNLLSRKTLSEIQTGNPNGDGKEVAYAYAYDAYEKALTEAFTTFEQKLANLDQLPAGQQKTLQAISQRFETYKSNNASWLEADALYEALAKEHRNDYWPIWSGPSARLDKNLFNPASAKEKTAADRRIQELKQKYKSDMGAYQFAQFVMDEQTQSFKKYAKARNLGVLADLPVGLSDRDVWANQALFLKGYSLGCPPDYFSKDGQAWGFPVLDPEKLFKPDGSLGEGGEFLKRLFEKTFRDAPGGVRIDHVIGLIDPWVYPAKDKSTKNGARLYSAPEHPALGKYAKIDQSALNAKASVDAEERVKPEAMSEEAIARYSSILEKIVIPAAKSSGVPVSSIICEDLGTLTNPVKAVLKKHDLSGIRVTQFVDPKNPQDHYRGKNVAPQHWITPGTHDNEPTLVWSQKLIAQPDNAKLHAQNLAEDLSITPAEKKPLKKDATALTRAKFIELFASPAKHVQVFFTDWLGMEQSYNKPGTVGNQNWSLRIPRNYKEAYLKALQSGRGLNLPEVMARALRCAKAAGKDHQALIQELDQYAAILKE